jgi:CRP/FNR family transcriptional regulator
LLLDDRCVADTSWLRAFPQLAAIEDPAWRRISNAAQVVRLPPGTVTFRQGDACQNYVMVVGGSIRVQKITEAGREIVLYRVEPGDTCVLTTSCLFGGTRYPAEGITESEVEAAVLPLKEFHEAVASSDGFRKFVFTSFGERMAELMLLVEAIAFGRVDVRLAERLLALGGNGARITTTHQQLAAELGTAREVVSRLLKEFERHGWLRLSRGQIEITDRAALTQLARAAAA